MQLEERVAIILHGHTHPTLKKRISTKKKKNFLKKAFCFGFFREKRVKLSAMERNIIKM